MSSDKKEINMDKIRGFANYGCLAAEKRVVFTAGSPAGTATCYDEVEYTIPEGWEAYETIFDTIAIEAPWGCKYSPDQLLKGNKNPYFMGIDKEWKEFRIKLEWRKL